MNDDVYQSPFTVSEMCQKLPHIADETTRPVFFRDGHDRIWPIIDAYNDETDDKTPCLMLAANRLDIARMVEKERLASHPNEPVE